MQNCRDRRGSDITALASLFALDPLAPTLESAKRLKGLEQAAILQAASYPSSTAARALLETRQYCALYTKNSSLLGSTPSVRRKVALDGFFAVEAYQRVVSKRLRHYTKHWSRMPDLVGKALFGARYEIFRLLGPAPSGDDLVETIEGSRFGPGSVGGIARKGHGLVDVTPYGKLSPDTVIQVTERALLKWGPSLRGSFRAWLDKQPAEIVDFCKGTCVPKDASKDRFIAVEPYLNSYIQLGQMNVLNRYLRRWGVDTRDQSWNQALARNYSFSSDALFDRCATIDLSSASDSVNYELVRFLFPPDWFDYLCSTRCPVIKVNGESVVLEKFSSMGNGITFPLETMIFSALIRSVRRLTGDELPWACYGDDIILGVGSALLLVEVLRFCGFKTNEDKSFIIGAFRESCGEDFLDGHGVRPIYLKSELSESAAYAFHNVAQRRGYPLTRLCPVVRQIWPGRVGPSLTPSGDGDTHYVAPDFVLLKDSRVSRRWVSQSKTWSQTWVYTFVARFKRERRVGREEKQCSQPRAYLAFLAAGMLSDPHPYRGKKDAVVYYDRVVKTGSTYWLSHYDLSWYERP